MLQRLSEDEPTPAGTIFLSIGAVSRRVSYISYFGTFPEQSARDQVMEIDLSSPEPCVRCEGCSHVIVTSESGELAS
jgi:hypothetical protein